MTPDAIESWLVSHIADTLQIDGADLDRTMPLTSYGLDSLGLLTLTGELAEMLERDLSTTLVWEYPTIETLAKHLAAPAEDNADGFIPRAPRDRPLPLSFAQERIWRYAAKDEGGDKNLRVEQFILSGSLDVDALRRSVTEIIRRHEILRTTFSLSDGQPVQLIHPPPDTTVQFTDLSGETDPAAEALSLLQAGATQSMHLDRGPLIRVMLMRLSESEHRLVIVLHHLLYDASSLRTLYAELGTLYAAWSQGMPPELPDLSFQMADFAVWQRNSLRPDGEAYQRKLAWWRRYWSGAMPAAIELPFQRARLPEKRGKEDEPINCTLPAELAGRIEALARGEGATVSMIFLAAFEAVLHQLTGHSEFVVGTYVSDRGRHSAQESIGFFVNLLALRVRFEGHPTFREVLRQVRGTFLEASPHLDLPFEELIRELQAEGSPPPLVQVIFQHIPYPVPALELSGLQVKRWITKRPPRKLWGLSMSMDEVDGHFRARVLYDTNLYEAAGVVGMLQDYQALLEQIVADPDCQIRPSYTPLSELAQQEQALPKSHAPQMKDTP